MTELEAGRDAFARQAWAQAFAQLSAADAARAPLDVDDLERLAISAYVTGRDEASDDLWTRAHNECLRVNDIPRATRCIFWLVLSLLGQGEMARANGWLARAERLLDDGACDCPERGLLLVLTTRTHLKVWDIATAHDNACQAVALAHRFDDAELRMFSRLILAQVQAKRGDCINAVRLLDEIMVAITLDDVSPIAVGIVYCAVIEICYSLYDFGRAREWTAALSQWCSTHPDLVAFRGQCLVHRTEVMRLGGAWSEAMTEAEQTCNWLAPSIKTTTNQQPLPPFKYPIGPAFYQLAEIHRLRGDFAKADAAYQQASQCGYSPEPGLALLRLAQGRTDAAAAVIRRELAEEQTRLKRVSVLVASVEIMIAAADLPMGRRAAEELAAIAKDADSPYLRTLAAHAMGRVLVAEGDARAALAQLRLAWMGWQEIEAPWEAAHVRVLLGRACRALGDEETAEMEFNAAQRVFERLGAAPDVDRVAQLRRGLPTALGAGVLTPRERQIIGLVATGKTNRAIAQQLAISERTVDRHVSNILLKLDLPSRTAATAYAYERGLL